VFVVQPIGSPVIRPLADYLEMSNPANFMLGGRVGVE